MTRLICRETDFHGRTVDFSVYELVYSAMSPYIGLDHTKGRRDLRVDTTRPNGYYFGHGIRFALPLNTAVLIARVHKRQKRCSLTWIV